VFVPIKLYTINKNTKIKSVQYYQEAACDVIIPDFESHEHTKYEKPTTYSYLGDRISFYGYNFNKLTKILQEILFDYSLTAFEICVPKWEKRGLLLGIFYCMEIFIVTTSSGIGHSARLNKVADDIRTLKKLIIEAKKNKLEGKKIVPILMSVSSGGTFNISHLFQFINNNLIKITKDTNINKFIKILNIIRRVCRFYASNLNIGNIYKRTLDSDKYRQTLIKYKSINDGVSVEY
jgi:hypothetical protein